jgi:membrane protease YdiL (CAAX protease family)
VQGPGPVSRASALDFLIVLFIWLPIEFNAGARLIPQPAQGFLHSVAYGIAILLGLIIFLGYRSVDGMKFNLPRRPRDYWLPLAAFVVSAPVLAAVGIALRFIPAPHAPTQSMGRMTAAASIIFVATALPEEILFRSLIQNFFTLRFGENTRTLLLAAFIFGCAHLDNGPQPLPNWRYMILATIAGVAYGLVFRKSSTVLSSAGLHMMVDWTKHFFF